MPGRKVYGGRSRGTWKPRLRSRQGKILKACLLFRRVYFFCKDGYPPDKEKVVARCAPYEADSGNRLGTTRDREPGSEI